MDEEFERREIALLLPWLQAWDTMQCWDREAFDATHSVTFRTLPDPGWVLEIELAGTELEHVVMSEVAVQVPLTETTGRPPTHVGDRGVAHGSSDRLSVHGTVQPAATDGRYPAVRRPRPMGWKPLLGARWSALRSKH
jgi:hypothetical protein